MVEKAESQAGPFACNQSSSWCSRLGIVSWGKTLRVVWLGRSLSRLASEVVGGWDRKSFVLAARQVPNMRVLRLVEHTMPWRE